MHPHEASATIAVSTCSQRLSLRSALRHRGQLGVLPHMCEEFIVQALDLLIGRVNLRNDHLSV